MDVKTLLHFLNMVFANVQVESPQLKKTSTAGRSKSFSNHRPLDPEFIAQVEHSSQVLLTV